MRVSRFHIFPFKFSSRFGSYIIPSVECSIFFWFWTCCFICIKQSLRSVLNLKYSLRMALVVSKLVGDNLLLHVRGPSTWDKRAVTIADKGLLKGYVGPQMTFEEGCGGGFIKHSRHIRGLNINIFIKLKPLRVHQRNFEHFLNIILLDNITIRIWFIRFILK